MSEKITKPCRVGGVIFQVGVNVDTVIEASQRLYESQLNNPENPLVEMKELRKLIMGTHVLVPKNQKTVVAIENMVYQQVEASGIDEPIHRLDGWRILEEIIEAVEKDDAQQNS